MKQIWYSLGVEQSQPMFATLKEYPCESEPELILHPGSRTPGPIIDLLKIYFGALQIQLEFSEERLRTHIMYCVF